MAWWRAAIWHRGDYQLTSNTRLMGRVSGSQSYTPFGGGSATSHPASTTDTTDRNREYLGSFTQVLSNRAVNEIKGGYSHYGFENKTQKIPQHDIELALKRKQEIER